MKTKLLNTFGNPYVVMGIVIVMYALKSFFKITIGTSVNSPMISGDGYHNLADILEALAVIAVIFVAKLPTGNEYPFGRKNIEFFSSLAIGAGLLFLSLQFALKSVVGLLSFFPSADSWTRALLPLPDHQPLVMDSATFPWVVGITAGSVILSLLVSRYQISIGRSTGHASLVADGEETSSDGRIEMVVLAGILAEYIFHAAWLEYPLGLVVAYLIMRTGLELFGGAWKVLLQHSLDSEHEDEIRRLCMRVPGVISVTALKSFQVGHTAVVMLTVETRRKSETISHMKYGIEYTLRNYLLGDHFKECELQIRFTRPQPERHRVAYALRIDGDSKVIADNVDAATHLIVCDIERGGIHRSKLEPKPDNLLAFLQEKRVSALYLFGEPTGTLGLPGVQVRQVPSYIPQALGLL